MKKIISAILVIVCLISCLTVCANATYDTIGNARNATIGTTYSGTLSKNNEYDYYKFTVSSSGRVNFTFTAYAKSTVYVDLYDSNKEHIDYFGIYPSDQLGYCFEKHTGYFTKGVFYLCIDSLGSSVRYGNYSISTSFTSANETFSETINANDNVIGKSNNINLNTKVYGQLGYSDPIDYYSINIPTNGKLTFNAIAYAESTVYVSIYDEDINEVEYFGIYPEKKLGYCYCKKELNLSPGKYYVAIDSLNSSVRVGLYNFIINYNMTIPKPSGFKCTVRTTSSEKVAWNKVAGVTGYQVQCSDGGTKWAQNKVTSGNSAVFSGLTAGGKYKFRVRAYKKIDGVNYFSAWSPTLNSCAKPATVTLKGVSSPKHTQIKTTWAKAGGVVSGYQIYYGKNASFTLLAAKKNVSGKSTTSYTGKNFTKGRTYYVKVRTYTVFNGVTYYGAWSATKKVKSK